MEEIIFLALTVAVELPMALIVMPKSSWKRVGWVVLCINMVTHPIAWSLSSAGVPWLRVEAGVIVVEIIAFTVLFPASRKRAATAAGLMNALSAGIGAIFF